MKFLCNLLRDSLDTANCLDIEFLRWELKCSVTRVNACELNVLRDSVCDNLTILCNAVEVNLLGVLDELTYYNRVLLRDVGCKLKELLKLLTV